MSNTDKRSTRRGRVVGTVFAAALFFGAPFLATTVASAEIPVIDMDDFVEDAAPIEIPVIDMDDFVEDAAPENEIGFFDFCPNKKPNDCDGDGLSDDTEYSLGTSPLLVDTDNDGWYDHAEVQLGTDPRDPSS